MATLQHIDQRAEAFSAAHENVLGQDVNLDDIRHAYRIGALEILRDFVSGLTKIIDEEEMNADKYHFTKEEHEGFVFALKRIRDTITEALEKVGKDIF